MMPENCHFFGPDEVPDDFSDGLVDVALLNCLKEPRARRIKPRQEKMLTLQLLAEGELLSSNAQCIESQSAGSLGRAFTAHRFWLRFFFFRAAHLLPSPFLKVCAPAKRLHSPR